MGGPCFGAIGSGLFGVLCLAATVVGQGRVWVVDDDAGAGVDAGDLQQAVDMASAGDFVLVRSGAYGAFTLDGKALRVVAERDAVVDVQGTVLVRNLPAETSALIAGLRVTAAGGALPLTPLVAEGCAGGLHLEACVWAAKDGDPVHPSLQLDGGSGAVVDSCSSVTFVRCALSAGQGADLSDADIEFANGAGGHGIDVRDSRVHVYDCIALAGRGGHSTENLAVHGGDGGHGVRMSGGFLFLNHSVIEGKDGGGASCAPDTTCGVGGDGGYGVYADGNDPRIEFIDCAFAWGFGGAGGSAAGANGLPYLSTSGLITAIYVNARRLEVRSPEREQSTLEVIVRGEPGDVVNLVASRRIIALHAPQAYGVLFTGSPLRAFPLGAIGPSGELKWTPPLGELGPGVEAAAWVLQATVQDASGTALATGPSFLVALDGAY